MAIWRCEIYSERRRRRRGEEERDLVLEKAQISIDTHTLAVAHINRLMRTFLSLLHTHTRAKGLYT